MLQCLLQAWESKVHDATRRLARQRAQADKERQAAAARVNLLVAKLELLERTTKEAMTQLAQEHQKQVRR